MLTLRRMIIAVKLMLVDLMSFQLLSIRYALHHHDTFNPENPTFHESTEA
jgi:hypothetical protein